MQPLETIEADIRAAIERARQLGWTIGCDKFVDDDEGTCCAIGAFHLRETCQYKAYYRWARMRWGINAAWFRSLTGGFDGLHPDVIVNRDPSAYALGVRLRGEFVDTPDV